ncbi:MAG: hypothetical protein ACOCZ7_04195, partial [Armatimonadota bacterium]
MRENVNNPGGRGRTFHLRWPLGYWLALGAAAGANVALVVMLLTTERVLSAAPEATGRSFSLPIIGFGLVAVVLLFKLLMLALQTKWSEVTVGDEELRAALWPRTSERVRWSEVNELIWRRAGRFGI